MSVILRQLSVEELDQVLWLGNGRLHGNGRKECQWSDRQEVEWVWLVYGPEISPELVTKIKTDYYLWREEFFKSAQLPSEYRVGLKGSLGWKKQGEEILMVGGGGFNVGLYRQGKLGWMVADSQVKVLRGKVNREDVWYFWKPGNKSFFNHADIDLAMTLSEYQPSYTLTWESGQWRLPVEKLKNWWVNRKQITTEGSKKKYLILGLIVGGLLLISIVVGGMRNKELREQGWVKQEQRQLDQIKKELTTDRKLNLDKLTQLSEEIKSDQSKLTLVKYQTTSQKILKEVDQLMQREKGETDLDRLDVWFDLKIIKEGFEGDILALRKNLLVVFDTTHQWLAEINLTSKQGKMVAQITEQTCRVKAMTTVEANILTTCADGEMWKINQKDPKTPPTKIRLPEKTTLSTLAGFQSSIYLVNETEGQIVKLPISDLSLGKNWLSQAVDSWQSNPPVSLEVNGDIFSVSAEGKMERFRQGKLAKFYVTDLPQPLGNKVKLAVNPEVNKLVVWDETASALWVIDRDKMKFLKKIIHQDLKKATDIILLSTGEVMVAIKSELFLLSTN